MSERLRQLRREPRDELEGAEREVLKMARREQRRRTLDRIGWLLAILLWGLSFWADKQQDDRITNFAKETTEQRARATLDSCRERNAALAVQRRQVQADIVQTRGLPDRVFEEFEISRAEAIADLESELAHVQPLEPTCRERVTAVRKELEGLE